MPASQADQTLLNARLHSLKYFLYKLLRIHFPDPVGRFIVLSSPRSTRYVVQAKNLTCAELVLEGSLRMLATARVRVWPSRPLKVTFDTLPSVSDHVAKTPEASHAGAGN